MPPLNPTAPTSLLELVLALPAKPGPAWPLSLPLPPPLLHMSLPTPACHPPTHPTQGPAAAPRPAGGAAGHGRGGGARRGGREPAAGSAGRCPGFAHAGTVRASGEAVRGPICYNVCAVARALAAGPEGHAPNTLVMVVAEGRGGGAALRAVARRVGVAGGGPGTSSALARTEGRTEGCAPNTPGPRRERPHPHPTCTPPGRSTRTHSCRARTPSPHPHTPWQAGRAPGARPGGAAQRGAGARVRQQPNDRDL
jgi:hypothetical protein